MRRVFYVLILIAITIVVAACGGAPATAPEVTESNIELESLPQDVDIHTVFELKDHEDVYLLDVREQYEYDEKHIPGVTLLPISEIEGRVDEVPTDKTVLVTCRSGNRSNQVTQFLRNNGFDNVHNMTGGIVAWEEAGYPVE